MMRMRSAFRARRTYHRQTKVKLKRSRSHLSVKEMAWFIFPLPCVVGDCREMSTDRESSILTKLARPRTYLIRMATMQTPPTSQPRNTRNKVSSDVREEVVVLGLSRARTRSTADDQSSGEAMIEARRKGKDDRQYR